MQVTGWTTVLRFTRRGDRSLSQRRSLPQTSLSVKPTKHIMLKKTSECKIIELARIFNII